MYSLLMDSKGQVETIKQRLLHLPSGQAERRHCSLDFQVSPNKCLIPKVLCEGLGQSYP